MPPWSRSTSTFAMFLRVFHCSRRRPATQASSVASLRFNGSTLRISQHATRRSTLRYIRFGPSVETSCVTASRSGYSNSTAMPYRSRTSSNNVYVSGGRRPVSSVNTRISGLIRHAMSISAMPSTPPAALMAMRGWNRSSAHSSSSSAVACSKRSAAAWIASTSSST